MKTSIFVLTAAVAIGILASCAGVPKEIPQSFSAAEIIQRAQEASDAYHYKAALAYYQALEDRFGSDPSYLTIAKYEIAFIDYKEGRYAMAQDGFEKLLATYSAPGGETLPQSYKILAEKVLAHIKELVAPKK